MKKEIISWVFGSVVLILGLMNLLRGNDPGLGLALLVASLFYFPPVLKVVKHQIGLTIPGGVQIVLGILIVWVNLAVGAIAEGYY